MQELIVFVLLPQSLCFPTCLLKFQESSSQAPVCPWWHLTTEPSLALKWPQRSAREVLIHLFTRHSLSCCDTWRLCRSWRWREEQSPVPPSEVHSLDWMPACTAGHILPHTPQHWLTAVLSITEIFSLKKNGFYVCTHIHTYINVL